MVSLDVYGFNTALGQFVSRESVAILFFLHEDGVRTVPGGPPCLGTDFFPGF